MTKSARWKIDFAWHNWKLEAVIVYELEKGENSLSHRALKLANSSWVGYFGHLAAILANILPDLSICSIGKSVHLMSSICQFDHGGGWGWRVGVHGQTNTETNVGTNVTQWPKRRPFQWQGATEMTPVQQNKTAQKRRKHERDEGLTVR